MDIKTNFLGKIEDRKEAVYRLKTVCTLSVYIKYIYYDISLSFRTFRRHDREPLFGHGNSFGRGLPVVKMQSFGSGSSILSESGSGYRKIPKVGLVLKVGHCRLL